MKQLLMKIKVGGGCLALEMPNDIAIDIYVNQSMHANLGSRRDLKPESTRQEYGQQ